MFKPKLIHFTAAVWAGLLILVALTLYAWGSGTISTHVSAEGGGTPGQEGILIDIALELLFVGLFAVVVGLIGRWLYSAALYPLPDGANPVQRVMLPGEDEARFVDAELKAQLLQLKADREAGKEVSGEQAYLIGHLAEASAKRGHARLMGDAIFTSTVVFASILAFAPMAKSMLRSFF